MLPNVTKGGERAYIMLLSFDKNGLCFVVIHHDIVRFFFSIHFLICNIKTNLNVNSIQARSQPVFSGKPGFIFCLSCTFIFRTERNWMKKSARVSEQIGKPGLTWHTGSYAPGILFKKIVMSRSVGCAQLSQNSALLHL